MIRSYFLLIPILVIFAVIGLSGCATSPQHRKQVTRLHHAAVLNAQLGINYMRTGELKKADKKLKQALRQDPDSYQVRNAYALLMQRLGKNGEAERNFSKAVQLKPNSGSVHNNFGVFLCEQGNYHRAYKQFKAAWSNRLYSTPEYAYANAGVCAVKQGKKSLAEKDFKQALDYHPDFAPALYQLAKLASEQGHKHKAAAYLKKIKASDRYTPDILSLCLKVKRALGDMNGAANCARDLYRMFPNSPQAKALLGNQ